MRLQFTLLIILMVTVGAGCMETVAPEATTVTASPGAVQDAQTPTLDGGAQATRTRLGEPTSTREPLRSGTPQSEATTATTPEPGITTELPQVTFAREDLARRLNLAPEAIEVLEVELRTWPDASLGCPLPGMAYAQVVQEGLLIRLQAESQIYNYHSGGTSDPFLCDQSNIPQKSTPPLDIELMTQPPPY